MNEKQQVLVIVGPTGVGKTALSIQLAQKFDGEIISGDSLQVYRQLNIGTAKVTEEEMQGIPHFLIDIIEPDASYTAYDFKCMAEQKIDEISRRGKLPIIVGGTGMYIQSLLFDFNLGKKDLTSFEKECRKKWESFAATHGAERLWLTLQEMDPSAAAVIHPNNQKRVIRALEVFDTTGISITAQQQLDLTDLSQSQYDCKIMGLTSDRSVLYDRINLRVDEMMNNGLLAEAEYVYQLGDVQAKQGIGYKEFFPYFTGEMILNDAVDLVKQHSRKYAKRQLTWFRNRMPVEWWDIIQHPEQQDEIKKDVATWVVDNERE